MDRRTDSKSGWTLTLESAGRMRKQDVDFVAICTGQFSDKNIITHPGQDAFIAQGGEVMHSSEYTDPEMIRGKRVVVLGGSKSATDIAVSAAKRGAKSVALVYRQNVWRVPYLVGGINFKRLLYMRAQEVQFNGWKPSLFGRILSTVTKPLVWANFRGLETMLKLQLGLKKWGMVPDTPIEKEASCSLPLVTPGMFDCFKDGSVRPIRSTISHYEGDSVVLENGEKIGCDTAILAVGWKLGIPYLPQSYRDKLIEEDGQYRTYRLAVNPDLPDMGFVGFNSSFCTVLSAEMIANWLVRYADGQLAQQPTRAEMESNIDMMLHWRRHERPAAQVYGGLCSAPFHFRHFDELLSDIGARLTKRKNPLAEQFSYPDASAYGRFLASAPKYQVG
jgi:cation diffusion facilitator CzcD-associated flavoprotein CzcO